MRSSRVMASSRADHDRVAFPGGRNTAPRYVDDQLLVSSSGRRTQRCL